MPTRCVRAVRFRPDRCIRDRPQMLCAVAGARARRRAGRSRGSSVARPRCARVPCDARSEVAPRNSLHSLCSLRSNTRGESDHEARGYARRPQPWPCRPRWAQAPSRSPGTNSPLDCSCPGSPPRRRTGAPPRTRPRLCEAAPVLGWRNTPAGHRARLAPARAPAARGKPRARCPRLAFHSHPRTTVPARRRAGRRRGEWRRREAQG